MRWLPLLKIQKDLLDTPRGPARFRHYLATMLDSDGKLRLPLAAFNPMAKPHVAALLSELLTIDAESIGCDAMRRAVDRLPGFVGTTIHAGLVLADDALGGWTNRFLYEAKHQFETRYERTNGFITALLWSSEAVSPVTVQQTVTSAIYRHHWIGIHGQANTLRERLLQEGMSASFAGRQLDFLAEQEARILGQHLETTRYPTIIACLYGDQAAVSCGYAPLGLPPHAGLRYALSNLKWLADYPASMGGLAPSCRAARGG